MPRRLHQTAADYVVIAISPALIMTLVGSLVFFLLTVFYRGEYPERLTWVMACFIFGAVLIGRISIEEGFERAAPFGIGLAIVVAMATNAFLQFHGRSIESFSWLVNWGLIALIWWCAHRLTWDCTMIDDEQDASGEGLLQIAGIEGRKGDDQPSETDHALEGTTSRQVPSGWWQRYVEHQRRPHAPGVWVVYFSLAALPLFGIGGWFIPSDATGLRRYAFWLLCVYVASGLGLLLTTSFLGLRRYLRQRRIEMPTLMANLWLGMGAGVIVLLLVFAALLPRPNAEYAISELPLSVGSPKRESSDKAPVPREGTQDEQSGSAPQRTPDEDSPSNDQQQPRDADSEKSPGTDSDNSSPSDDKRPDGQATEPGSQGKGSSEGKNQEGKSNSRKESKGSDDQGKQADQSQPSESQAKAKQAETEQTKAPQAPSAESPAATPPLEVPPVVQAPLGFLAELLKWAFYAAFALAVLYALWQFRTEVLRAIRDFLTGVSDFWAGLWGRRRRRDPTDEDQAEPEFPPAPFSTFADPFATGIDRRYSLDELVRYSFEAFEAWSREHGCQRQPDQTPHELARVVARRIKPMTADAKNIAELYSRAAYAEGELPDTARQQLRQLWQSMRTSAGQPR